MTGSLPPPLVVILGALLVPFLKGRVRSAYLLALPVISFAFLLGFDKGASWHGYAFGHELTLMRVDQLSLVFSYIFHIALFVGLLFALHVKDTTQHVAALIYGGSALGAVLAGDLIVFWLCWEVMAVSSTFLVLARKQPGANGAAMRSLMVQLVSGLLVLVGIALHVHHTGSIAFDSMTPDSGSILDLEWTGAGTLLIFLGLGIKCGWPLLHNWICDAYPAATVTGSVFLSAFTTKTAVYALARGFPGTEELIWIGTGMAVFPIFFAVIENDVRRVLCYSMINQVGFMVVGVGIGTPLAISGTAAHAFCHILYKALLFMTAGAVIYRTGRTKCTDLGGLHRTMPWTTAFCVVGAASISAFPLFSGFIAKSLIMIAAAQAGQHVVWLLLLFAAAGVFHHAGIKIPFFVFFSHDSGLRPKEAPKNMLFAMGLGAAACIGIGAFPELLYRHLPYAIPPDAMPYTAAHVIQQTQLLVWSALAFCTLMLTGLYPPELRSVNLDSDVWYRRGAPAFVRLVSGPLMAGFGWLSRTAHETVPYGLRYFAKNPAGAMKLAVDRFLLGYAGVFRSMGAIDRAQGRLVRDQRRYEDARPGAVWPIGTTVLYSVIAFLVFLLVYLIR
jgi:multicomponent Na+:H+ antiporter subunit D